MKSFTTTHILPSSLLCNQPGGGDSGGWGGGGVHTSLGSTQCIFNLPLQMSATEIFSPSAWLCLRAPQSICHSWGRLGLCTGLCGTASQCLWSLQRLCSQTTAVSGETQKRSQNFWDTKQHLTITQKHRKDNYPHFEDGETEVQRGKVIGGLYWVLLFPFLLSEIVNKNNSNQCGLRSSALHTLYHLLLTVIFWQWNHIYPHFSNEIEAWRG